MKRCVILAVFLLLVAVPFVAAYGVTFYNPAWNPQDGKVFESVNANEPYEVIVRTPDIAITKVIFYVNDDFNNAGITVYNLKNVPDDLPETPENTTYEVNEIKYTGFVPHQTVNFVYYFKVNKTWLEENMVSRNSMVLHYLDEPTDSWVPLRTEVKGDDDGFVYFKAEYKGVHYLYIGTTEGVAVEPPGEDEVEIIIGGQENLTEVTPVDLSKPQKALPTPVAAPPEEPPESAPVESDDSFLAILFLIIMAVVIFLVIMLLGARRKPKVDRELRSYVRHSLKQGKSKAEIRENLLSVGWHPSRVDKVLSKHKDTSVSVSEDAKVASDVVAEAVARHGFPKAKERLVHHESREAHHLTERMPEKDIEPFVLEMPEEPAVVKRPAKRPVKRAVKKTPVKKTKQSGKKKTAKSASKKNRSIGNKTKAGKKNKSRPKKQSAKKRK